LFVGLLALEPELAMLELEIEHAAERGEWVGLDEARCLGSLLGLGCFGHGGGGGWEEGVA
jgi:hypothetical protein